MRRHVWIARNGAFNCTQARGVKVENLLSILAIFYQLQLLIELKVNENVGSDTRESTQLDTALGINNSASKID